MTCYHEYKLCNQYALRCRKCKKVIIPHKNLINFMRIYNTDGIDINKAMSYFDKEENNKNSAG